jgi:hypothetical protein
MTRLAFRRIFLILARTLTAQFVAAQLFAGGIAGLSHDGSTKRALC